MRLLVKLSGEYLKGDALRYDALRLKLISDQISSLQKSGNQVALVVGGGNLFRGAELISTLAIERGTADYIGMLATVQNALVLRDYFETQGIATRVSSAVSMPQICESYMPKRAIRHLDKGRVVIFASGLGVPFFTTDTTAVQRALEIHADFLILAKNGVDGLYTADPEKNPQASFIKEVKGSEVLEKNLRVADQAAIALAKDHGLKIKVVGVMNIHNAVDDTVGSVILPI